MSSRRTRRLRTLPRRRPIRAPSIARRAHRGGERMLVPHPITSVALAGFPEKQAVGDLDRIGTIVVNARTVPTTAIHGSSPAGDQSQLQSLATSIRRSHAASSSSCVAAAEVVKLCPCCRTRDGSRDTRKFAIRPTPAQTLACRTITPGNLARARKKRKTRRSRYFLTRGAPLNLRRSLSVRYLPVRNPSAKEKLGG